MLGIIWLPLTALLFASVLTFVFHQDGQFTTIGFFFYVLSGYTLWSFISRSVTDSTTLIQKHLEPAVHNGMTLPGLYAKALLERTIEYAVNYVVFFALALVLLPGFISPNLGLFIPAFLLIGITSIAISYVVNVIALLVPDAANLVKTGMRLLFFASPVFWYAGENGHGIRETLLLYNPASYYLDITRQAGSIVTISGAPWAGATLVTLAFALAAFVTYQWSNKFIRNIR